MWKTIKINKQNVELQITNATLIKIPKKSRYANYKFWHPNKLIEENENSIKLSYTNEFVFHLKKFGKGKLNKYMILDEIDIDAEEFEEIFDKMADSVREKENNTYLIIKEPKKIEKTIVVDEELKNE